jgi:hypothetical protein
LCCQNHRTWQQSLQHLAAVQAAPGNPGSDSGSMLQQFWQLLAGIGQQLAAMAAIQECCQVGQVPPQLLQGLLQDCWQVLSNLLPSAAARCCRNLSQLLPGAARTAARCCQKRCLVLPGTVKVDARCCQDCCCTLQQFLQRLAAILAAVVAAFGSMSGVFACLPHDASCCKVLLQLVQELLAQAASSVAICSTSVSTWLHAWQQGCQHLAAFLATNLAARLAAIMAVPGSSWQQLAAYLAASCQTHRQVQSGDSKFAARCCQK